MKKNMFALFLLSMFVVTSVTQAEPEEATEKQSLLWKISGNGIEKPSYLFGTMHVSKKLAFNLGEEFYKGIESADIVAMEANPASMIKDMMASPLFGGAYSAMKSMKPRRNDMYTVEFQTLLPTDIVLGKMLAKEDNLINSLLYRRMPGFQENFGENTYLDLFLFQAARKLNKETINLEDFEEMSEQVLLAMIPDEEKDKDRYRNASKLREKLIPGQTIGDLIEDAYREGNISYLDSITRMLNPSENHHKHMIVERNRIMIARLDSLLKLKTVFTGVGAAHLPGQFGMINMLRELGYTVEACDKIITDETMAKRKEIDKLRYELSFETHYPSDSVFSVSAPGEFSVVPSVDDYTQMYYPDPINGSYFAVLRLRTYADLYNKSTDDLYMMIDSLFYENIPGEIQEKKEISVQGLRGFDITNKLVRGDYQRYKIFITPLEIILFKMSGPDDFVTTENNSEFFDSVKFNFTHYSEPQTYHDARGGFDIKMSGMAVSNFNVEDSRNEEFHEIASVDTTSGEFFMLRRTSIFDFEYIEEDTFELNYIIEQYADARDFHIKEMQLAAYKHFPSIDAVLEKDDLKLDLRVIKQGVKFFLLIAKTENSNHKDDFFNSLEFTEQTGLSEYINYTDTLLHCSVTCPEQPKDIILQEVMKDIRSARKKDEIPFDSEYKTTHFVEPRTSEPVLVEFVRMHKYHSEKNIDSFWTYRRELMLNDSTLKIRSFDTDSSDGMYYMNVSLVDTNSIKVIRKRTILKAGARYILTSIGDTLTPPSKFVKTFFDSFVPADTVFGESLFADHSGMFFKALALEDSTERHHALHSLTYFEFKDKDAEDLMELLDDFDFDADESKYRLKLIKALGKLKNDEIVDFLDEYFDRTTDTLQAQLAVLTALSEQKSKESCAKFLELLDRDTPLASDYSDIRDIFHAYEDSLEIAVYLFPELLSYLQYPEYKYSVTRLAAMILEKGLPDTDILKGHEKIIIREARNDLKRRISSEDQNEAGNSDYPNNTNYDISYRKKGHNRYLQLNFAIMLMNRAEEPAVEKYLEKLLKSSNNEMRIFAVHLLLKNNIDFDHDVINEIAEKRQDRRMLYVYLDQVGKSDLMDDEYKSRQAFAENQIYPEEYDDEKDSLVYLEEKYVKVKGYEGWFRFYKRYRKGDESTDNFLTCTGLFPDEKDSVRVNNILTYRSITLDEEEKDLEDEIEKLMKRIRIYKRSRAFIKKTSGYYN